jgi:hypothetical protein
MRIVIVLFHTSAKEPQSFGRGFDATRARWKLGRGQMSQEKGGSNDSTNGAVHQFYSSYIQQLFYSYGHGYQL